MVIAINVSNTSYQKEFVLNCFFKSASSKYVESFMYKSFHELAISRSHKREETFIKIFVVLEFSLPSKL